MGRGSMCVAGSPIKVAPNRGTHVEIVANSPDSCPAGFGNPGKLNPSWMSLVHSMPCKTINAVPKNIVASSQLRVQERSCRWAANTAITIVSELESRHAVMMVALMMLSLPNGIGHGVV